MSERYDDIKELFAKCDDGIMVDAAKKQAARNQITKLVRKQAVSAPRSKWQILKSQVCYMDKSVLTVHMAACLGTALLGNWQHWEEIAMIISGVLGALSLFEVGSLFFSRMAELEESCYFNVRQLVGVQMFCSGIISLAALFLALMFAGLKYEIPVMETCLYLLVPFVFTECVCMTVMLTEIGRKNVLMLVAAGIFSALFWGVISSMPQLYETSAVAFWGMALAAGTGIFAVQTKRFFHALDKGEILCAD